MWNQLANKIKESIISILPITLIVIILSFTPALNLSVTETLTFIVCAFLLMLGMSIFNFGADIAMVPMGKHVGEGLAKSRRTLLLLGVTFVMGFLITIAEPDLSVLASLVDGAISKTLIIVFVGLGVGLFLLISVAKIIFKKDLSSILLYFYMAVFFFVSLLLVNGKSIFVPLSFDSGGVTTGPVTVPFIMALGLGISLTIGGKQANESSFGLVALSSVGPIIALLILSLISDGNLSYEIGDYSVESNLSSTFSIIGETAFDVLKSIGLIIVAFLILNFTLLKLPKNKIKTIFIGILFTYLGLVVFLSAVSIGFMPIGFKLGQSLSNNKVLAIILSFVFGAVTVLAEPAVHTLNKQVEEVTQGRVTKRSMLIALSIGVGLSIGLSIIRIIFNFSLLYYLIPGYLLSLGLSFFVPKMYTAIAFDSGGVASGPLTSSFILPFAIGVCSMFYDANEVLNLAFGVVSMVAMAPLITIQLLGFKSVAKQSIKESIELNRILGSDDEEIIYFSRR